MPFSMPCTNRGCGKTQEPYVNLDDDKVYCSLCDREIVNITYFTKVQMKSLKQCKVRPKEGMKKEPSSFIVKCDKCKTPSRPQIVDDDVVCGNCAKPLDKLSLPFKNMLKEQLKTADKDVQ